MTFIISVYFFILPIIFSASLDDHFFLPKYFITFVFSILALLYGTVKIGVVNKKRNIFEKIFLLFIFLFTIHSGYFYFSGLIKPQNLINSLTIILFGIVIFTFKNKIDFDKAFDFLIISGCISGIIGIFQYYGIYLLVPKWGIRGMEWTKNSPIVYSTLGNPNYLCNFLTPLIPYTLFKFFNSKSLDSGYLYKKILYSFSFLVFSLTILVSYSRAGIINLFIGIILFFSVYVYFQNKISKKIIVSGIILFSIITLISVPFFMSNSLNKGYGYNKNVKTLKDRILNKTGSIQKRIVLWKNSIQLIKKFPFGVGEGNFSTEIIKIQAENFKNAPIYQKAFWSYAKRAHNIFIQMLVDKGLITGSIFLILNISLVFFYFKSIRFKVKTNISYFVSFIIILIQGLVSFPLMLPVSSVLYYSLIVMCINYNEEFSKVK